MTTTSPNTDTNRFDSEGYCLFPNVLDAADVDAARLQLDGLIEGLGADQRPEHLSEPQNSHAYWLELCRHPSVLDAVEKAIGPNLALIMSHLIVKRAGDGLAVEWHQDNTTWPAITGTDIVTLWLALDKVDVGNGAMQVIARSHDGCAEMEMVATNGDDMFGFKVPVTPAMEADAIAIELEPGSASIHDSFILHGSRANTSGRRRAGYTMRYANSLTTRIDFDSHFSPVYLVRGDDPENADRFVDIRPGKPLPSEFPVAIPGK